MALISRDSAFGQLAESLWLQLEPDCPGLSVEFVEEIASTNSALLERARRGDTAPCLLVARTQTAGRGRLGRTWWSQPDDSLTFSLALPLAPADWSGLSLAVGLAVAQALEPRLGPREPGLKWPNDLWLRDPAHAAGGRKLGGILIETAALPGTPEAPAGAAGRRLAVIGVGLNVRSPAPGTDAARYSSGHACVQERDPQARAADVLQDVAPRLLGAVTGFERDGFAPLRQAWAARDVLAGRDVRAGDLQGRVQGVSETGQLLVHTDAGLRAIASGEVSVRPC